MNDITFIVCTKNSIDTIYNCLTSIKNYPVILVDKDSNDGTLEVTKRFDNVIIIKQKGNGIADARNIGLKKVKTEYVCMWGSDNVYVSYESVYVLNSLWGNNQLKIENIIDYMKGKGWIGLSFQTRVYNPKTYLDKAINIWWAKRFTEGERTVIGTPCIYKISVLKKYFYDANCQFCDDSDLGERLTKAGLKQGYSPYYAYDVSINDLRSVARRWKIYGLSDSQYYKKYSKDWGIFRKIKSLLHPITVEWIGLNLYYLPFYFLIVSIRAYNYYKGLK